MRWREKRGAVAGAANTGMWAALLALLGLAAVGSTQMNGDVATAAYQGEPVATARVTVRAELLDFQCSEDCKALMRTIAEAPGPPGREEILRIAADRRLADVTYTATVRWWLNDGSYDDIGYSRSPLRQPWFADEFLRIATDGPEAAISGSINRRLSPPAVTPVAIAGPTAVGG